MLLTFIAIRVIMILLQASSPDRGLRTLFFTAKLRRRSGPVVPVM